MFGSSRSKPHASVPQGVHMYFSADDVIVAAMHQNLAGIYYEQSAPTVIQGMPSTLQLGAAFREAFEKFSIQDANLRDFNRSEWPAFKGSAFKSPKEFERTYRRVAAFGINASNAVVRASTPHPTHPTIELSVSFNPLGQSEQIGLSLMQLLEAARAS